MTWAACLKAQLPAGLSADPSSNPFYID